MTDNNIHTVNTCLVQTGIILYCPVTLPVLPLDRGISTSGMDGDLLLGCKYMDSLQESYFCIVTLVFSA